MFILDNNTYVERLKVPIINFGDAVEIRLNKQKNTQVGLKFNLSLGFSYFFIVKSIS